MAHRELVQSDIAFVKEQIEALLAQGNRASHENIVQIMEMDYIRALCECDNEIAILKTMTGIYKTEISEGISPTVFELTDSIRALTNVYHKLLFYLQRIWFEVEEEVQSELVRYVDATRLSPYAIYLVLQDSRIVDKDAVWKKVMRLWEKADEC